MAIFAIKAEATAVCKGIEMNHGNSFHYVTFELDSGERIYFQVSMKSYMLIVEGDRCLIKYRSLTSSPLKKLKSFERIIMVPISEENASSDLQPETFNATSEAVMIQAVEEPHADDDLEEQEQKQISNDELETPIEEPVIEKKEEQPQKTPNVKAQEPNKKPKEQTQPKKNNPQNQSKKHPQKKKPQNQNNKNNKK